MVGSNIFNILLVLGVTGVVTNARGVTMGYSSGMNYDMLFFGCGMVLLLLFMFTFRVRKIDRGEGAVFLLCYAAYFYFYLIL